MPDQGEEGSVEICHRLTAAVESIEGLELK